MSGYENFPIPTGYRWTGAIRTPAVGEIFLNDQGFATRLYSKGENRIIGACKILEIVPAPNVILEPPVAPKHVPDMINHPPHYILNEIEPISVIENWQLGFCLGNVVKYVARAKHKGSELDDLKKALWYLRREIEHLEGVDHGYKP
jgi:hypothetical protein